MQARRWLVVPAAGRGTRFSREIPKQYAMLGGRMVIERALSCFDGMNGLAGIVVALAADDTQLQMVGPDGVPVEFVTGGMTRAESVMAALDWLADGPAAADDWVLVHDAARPLLSAADRDRLVIAAEENGQGALLAIPVTDTLKRDDASGHVGETVPRQRLWRALTPQMFRLEALRTALIAAGPLVTDESSAIELAGGRPALVTGSPFNIKITTLDDLRLAEVLLAGEGGR